MSAGVLAGTAEVLLTYPIESNKIKAQLPHGLYAKLRAQEVARGDISFFSRRHYRGCGTMVIGNAAKTAVRFGVYDILSKKLQDKDGYVSPPASLAAGLFAGFLESVILVPFELAKVRQISSLEEDPRKNGTINSFRRIIQLHGPLGLFYGFLPTLLRQGATSAVRFTSFNTIRQMASGFIDPGDHLSNTGQTQIDLLASYIAIVSTMPIDVTKTRMETLSGRIATGGSNIKCVYQIFNNEGFSKFFSGTAARLLRATVSSLVMFSL
ncbi:mitochondrial carrier domain-containing protein [Dipodascopsis uninucleata]